jgi:hypothetical protein
VNIEQVSDSVFRESVRTVAKHALEMTENREITFEFLS